ncbi:Ig-like domain-containing protein, partial [Candidatus Eisenbacteria bacterium]
MKNIALVLAVTFAAGIFAGCGDDSGSGPSDSTAPTVTLTDPADGATGISPNRPVRISFSELMDVASLDSIFIDGIAVGAREYDDDTHSVTIWLAQMPEAGTEYDVRVSAAVQDHAGKGMGSDYTFSYTTGPFSCGSLYDPFEDNDGIATAKDVALDTWYWLIPSCGVNARFDYYRFTLADPAKATVKVNFVYADTTHFRWGISFFREFGDAYAQIGYAPVPFPQELSFHFSFPPGTYYATIYEQD